MATSNPLMCERCGQEIVPGSKVEMVGVDEFEGQRIFMDGEMIVVHAVCPEQEGGEGENADQG